MPMKEDLQMLISKREQYQNLRAAGKTYQDIADHFGISRQAVHSSLTATSGTQTTKGPECVRVFDAEGKLQCNKCSKWLGTARYSRADTPTGFAYTCKDCQGLSRGESYQRHYNYLKAIEYNGIERERENLLKLKVRLEERSKWLLGAIRAQEQGTKDP